MEKIYDLVLPASAADLDIAGLLDEHKLLRLHPHWFIEGEERRNETLFAALRDYDTEQTFSLGLQLNCDPAPDDPPESKIIIRITLVDYGVRELLFFVCRDNTTQVRIRYDEEEQVDDELEQNMLLWTRALQEYLRIYSRTTPYTLFFRLLMNRMVLQMNPSQRKICLMITKITVVEVVVIIVIVIGYVSFSQ